MVRVGFGEDELEYQAGESIEERTGLLMIYGPEKKLIALHQTWDHAEVVSEESE